MKHFFRALGLFLVIIVLGLAGFVVINYFEQSGGQTANTQTPVAK